VPVRGRAGDLIGSASAHLRRSDAQDDAAAFRPMSGHDENTG
jgi:hypothetical protein